MPIYMDRHDIPGATAEQVAEAHQLDLKIQDQYNCRGLTYWFDEDSCIAFCLIQAPDKDAVLRMHNDSHGLIPSQIIEVENDLVKAFLGRITDPQPQSSAGLIEKFINESGFRTIVYVEVKQPLLSFLRDKDEIKNIINIQNEIISKAFEQYKDFEIKDIEEGFLASFTSVSKAIKCAVEIQTAFLKYNHTNPENRILTSIGISTGGPVTEKPELFGKTIQLAIRLCKIAGKGEIVMATSTRNLFEEKKLNLHTEEIIIKFLEPAEEKFLEILFDATENIWHKTNFNISNFSRMIGLSKSQLNRRTTALTGFSPNEFIKEFKMQKALKLLEKQKGNISEIALETGFSNPSYFSRCFQKRFGVLPSKLS
jgi:AraC-like DNA-binding protein